MKEQINVFLSEEELKERVRKMGEEISEDYRGREIILICILKGAVFFACDLARHISLPVRMEFMRCSSYGDDTVSSGEVKITMDLDGPIEGKDVIVVEDIVDTGKTMKSLMDALKVRRPSSIRLCALMDKPERRVVDIEVDYSGFEVPDKFIVGYGLDYAQKYRTLPFIGTVDFIEDEDEQADGRTDTQTDAQADGQTVDLRREGGHRRVMREGAGSGRRIGRRCRNHGRKGKRSERK